jgi:hypothetical protein
LAVFQQGIHPPDEPLGANDQFFIGREGSTRKERSRAGLSGEKQGIGHRELRGETLHEGSIFWSLIINNARRVSFKWCAGENIEDFVSHTLLMKVGG